MQTFEWDGLTVLERRRAYLDFLVEIAGRIGACARLRGKRRLACLARQCDVERSTLIDWLTKGRMPQPQTLQRMAEHTGVPLARFHVALDLTKPQDLAAALEQEAPAIVLEPDLRRWLDFLATKPLAERNYYFDFLRRIAAVHLDADQT